MKPVYTLLLCLCCMLCIAQRQDYVWLSGFRSDLGYNPAAGIRLGNSILDFNYAPRQVRYDSLSMSFDATNTSICDEDGNLLFYTNGIYAANALDEKIEGSDSLNFGYVRRVYFPDMEIYGYSKPQGAIIIPSLDNINLYYLLHSFLDTINDWNHSYFTRRIYSTTIDMSANAGHGAVTTKEKIVVSDSLSGELSATRHANGRDWWVLSKKLKREGYVRILIDSTGPHALTAAIGDDQIPTLQDWGVSCFSPDGGRFAYASISTGLNIFDFDRCEGTLSNLININKRKFDRAIGLSFSPNGRYLYLTNGVTLYQIDAELPSAQVTIDTISLYDGSNLPYPAYFAHSQLGPDGKIYISCGNTDTVYHVINSPDQKGLLCDFRQHELSLKSPSGFVPNYPNYRLGALPENTCDTFTSIKDITKKEKVLKIFPNPAIDVATIDYGYTDWSKGEVVMEITNNIGQVVHSQKLPMYSGFQRLNIADYASGTYTVYIKRKNVTVATGKLVKNDQ